MRQKLIVISSILALLLSCKTTTINSVSDDNIEVASVRVLEIKQFKSVDKFKSVRENSDTIILISPNKAGYKIDSSKFVALRLKRVTRFRVGTMEQLGAYLITGNDTLWSGPSIKNAPRFYWIVGD